jgi:hypothetical protein
MADSFFSVAGSFYSPSTYTRENILRMHQFEVNASSSDIAESFHRARLTNFDVSY